MLYPQEIEVWYILPVIRKELAKALIKYNLNQKEIAEKMNVTEAAVSQYINAKRASLIILDEKIKEAVEISAKNIAENNSNIIKEVQIINDLIWKNKTICKVHMQQDKSVKKGCSVCFE
jgi:predicted transcriptional regulator